MSGEPIWSEVDGVNDTRLLGLLRETTDERALRYEREEAARATPCAQPTSERAYEAASEPPERVAQFTGGSIGEVSSRRSPTYGTTGSPTSERVSDLRGDALRAYDERDDLAEWLGASLGIRPGHDSVWSPGTQCLRVRLEVDDASRRWVMRILEGWPSAPPRRTLAVHEAYAISVTRTLQTVRGPNATRWKLRLLVTAGILEPAPVTLPDLPSSAPESACRVWAEVGYLVSLRGLNELPGAPFPLSAPWLHQWTGGRLTESGIVAGKRWLEDHGLLVRVGETPSRRGGKPTVLWSIKGLGGETVT